MCRASTSGKTEVGISRPRRYTKGEAQNYTMEWPQSGEQFRGCQTMKAFQDAKVGSRPPRRLRRVLVRDRLWVVEGVLDYSGEREVDFVLILELRDGKVLAQITPTQR